MGSDHTQSCYVRAVQITLAPTRRTSRPRCDWRRSSTAVLVLAVLLAAGPVVGQEAPTPTPDATVTPGGASTPPGANAAGEHAPPSGDDPCAPPEHPDGSWLDRFNRTLDATVCSSAVWFDSFFGDRRAVEEYRSTGGLVSMHLYDTAYDGFEARFSFRAHYALPNLNNRFDAFIGRQTRDEYLTDTADTSGSGNPYLGLDQEERMLVGLGWNPTGRHDNGFRVSAGVQLGLPMNPYVQARYRVLRPLGAHSQFHWRQTMFWERENHLGTTTRLDVERRLSGALLLRWSGTGTFSGGSDGVDWWTHVTLFHSLSPRRALAYTVWDSGATEGEVPVTEYGVRVTYRQRVARDWLFADVGPILSWPRRHREEPRAPSWGAVAGIEMQFGTWR